MKLQQQQFQQPPPIPQLQQPQPLIPMQNSLTSNYVPQIIPASVDSSSSAVTIVPYASNNSNNNPISVNNPIIPIALHEQSNTPNLLASIQTTTTNVPGQIQTQSQLELQSHESPPNHLCASQSIDQNTNYEKIPCINPNFSKIIELSVTPSPPPILEEIPSENSNDNSSVSSPYHTNEMPTAVQQQQQQSTEPKIPISHLMATNQYPSLNRMPPANIVQSFAPIYNQSNLQSHHQQQQQQQQSYGDELYSSYVNNPYNLTLDQNFANNQPVTIATTAPAPVTNESFNLIQTQSNASNLNVFQSINYFGATTDTTQIPPGSEVLFGGP